MKKLIGSIELSSTIIFSILVVCEEEFFSSVELSIEYVIGHSEFESTSILSYILVISYLQIVSISSFSPVSGW